MYWSNINTCYPRNKSKKKLVPASCASRGLGGSLEPIQLQPSYLSPFPQAQKLFYELYELPVHTTFDALLAALPPTGKALLLNQQGRHAGDYFATFPLEPAMVAPADRFLTECRRRVWLPLGICATRCPGASCNALLDAHGLHLLSCRLAGRLQSRAYPLERAWMQVCREAGGRVSRPQPLVRRLGLTANRRLATDARRLDFVVFGLPIFGGLPLCADAKKNSITSQCRRRPASWPCGERRRGLHGGNSRKAEYLPRPCREQPL